MLSQGSLSDPYSKTCNIIDPRSWCVEYERKLMREMKTISGGPMAVTVSAVGTELMYDSAPANGSIYKEVSTVV